MKNAVLYNARKDRKKRRQSPEWLQNAIPFDHDLCLIKHKNQEKKISRLCELSNRKENRRNLNVLLANLINVRKRIPVYVSLSPNAWKHTRYTSAGASTIKIIKKLNELKLINMKLGYYTEEDSRYTRIWSTDRLLKYFPKYEESVTRKPVELVELRDEEGNLELYEDDDKTRRIRTLLKNVNDVNSQAKIRFYKESLNASLVAIFKKDFTLYGRLHTRGYRHYQGWSGEERKEITINGDSVVELDYSGLHPHLLYANEGYQFMLDPYSIVDNRIEARSFLKQILLCMLNSSDELTAERAANYWLYQNHSERRALKRIGITRARPIMRAFIEAHRKINHYFCCGKETGLKVMNKDAQIALDVIHYFAKRRIPILAVHDSFLVQNQYEKKLNKVMLNMYSKHTNGFKIPIK